MKFYKIVSVLTFLYASETWTFGKWDVQRIQAAEMKFLRGLQGCSLLDRKRNEAIRRDLNIVSLQQKTEDHRRKWCEYFNRMPDIRVPVAALGYHPTGKRDVGRPWRRGSGTGLRPRPWGGDDDDHCRKSIVKEINKHTGLCTAIMFL